MEKLLDIINFKYSDPDIVKLLADISGKTSSYTIHFNQNEDSFVKCSNNFTVPAFAVHHDVNVDKPSDDYLTKLRSLLSVLTALFPDIFSGTRYFFDPAEILRPCFIQVFRIDESYYLYLLRPDLNIRLSDSRIISRATNDTTAEFETEKLYIDAVFIPIHKPDITASGGRIPLKRMFRSTWVGESGTGYHLNGQWIDHELTKILSAMFLPDNKRTYPYYPFKCEFTTVCFSPADLRPAGRKSFLSYLHKSLPMIEPELADIESAMKTGELTKTHPIFLSVKKKIPDEWTKIWTSLKISPYLNESEMREYILEFKLP